MGERRFTSSGVVEKGKKAPIHPVWRGVGILLIVLVPIMGYAGATLLLEENTMHQWFRVPGQLVVSGPDHMILVKLILTIIFGAVVYFLLMLVTFIIYRLFGPSRMGPNDVPPVRWKDQDRS
jgi:quinol-cytochrome oxidoreductase complex cytochrome b subunit